MLSDALFERALHWTASAHGEAQLLEIRRSFEDRTGPIQESTRDYESRIAHFFEWYMCSTGYGQLPVASFAAAHPELPANEREELAGWLRSHRSLWVIENITATQCR